MDSADEILIEKNNKLPKHHFSNFENRNFMGFLAHI
jgi:hypothetical protein